MDTHQDAGTERRTTRPPTEGAYLHLMPHAGEGLARVRWHVFQISESSPRITPAATVASWDEARTLASRAKRRLYIAEQAWQQMVAADVAPAAVPDEATLV